MASSSVCGDLANPLLVTFMLRTPAGQAPDHDDDARATPALDRPWGTYKGLAGGLAGLASFHGRGVAAVGGAAPAQLFPGLRPSASPLFPTYSASSQAASAPPGNAVPLFASVGASAAGLETYAGSANATPTPLFRSSAGAPAATSAGTSSVPSSSFAGSFSKPAASAGATFAASPASSFPLGGFSSFMASRGGGGGDVGGGSLEGAILNKMRREAERQRQLAAAKAEACD